MAENEQRPSKSLKRFRTAVILAVTFTVLSLMCRIGCIYLQQRTYKTYIGISESTALEERIHTYINAITLIPGRADAYLLLLDAYSEDGLFAKQESEQFLSVYNANHNSLKENSQEYAQLQSKIGFLYINGYEDISTVTRLRMALPFLRAANSILDPEDPQKLTVSCYCQIGTFYQDYIWDAGSVREITQSVIQELIDEIQITLASFLTDDITDHVFNMLGFEVAVCDLFYDQRDILADSVPEEQVMQILDDIYQNLPDANTLRKEQTKQLLQTLKENKNTYYEMLNRAYSRKEA